MGASVAWKIACERSRCGKEWARFLEALAETYSDSLASQQIPLSCPNASASGDGVMAAITGGTVQHQALPRHASSRRRKLRLPALLSAGALVATGLVVVPQTAQAANFTVDGTVFRDINSNGIYEPTGSPVEVGFADVAVQAFDASGAVVGSATSDADGTYSMAVTTQGTENRVRVEFDLTPEQIAEGYEHSFAADPVPGAAIYSGSSVQFLTLTSGTNAANFGVNHPEDYNTGSGQVLIPVNNPGNPLDNSATGDERGLVAVDWNASGQERGDQDQISATHVGTGAYGDAIGTVWGNAYDREGKVAYNSAMMRRFGGFGTANLGGIYKTDIDAKSTAVWINLEDAGIDVGGDLLDSALSLSNGSDAADRNAARGLLADPKDPITDENVFGLPGKIGLGATVLDAAGENVYVANLHGKSIIRIPVQSDGTAGTPEEISLGLSATEVPFGLHIQRGQLYVGITETALNTGNGTAISAAEAGRDQLGARVVSTPLADLSAWTTRINLDDLTFQRGFPDVSYFQNNASADLTQARLDRGVHWNAWSDDWSGTIGAACLNDSNSANANIKYCAFPQPVLSAVDFDSDGNMILGFSDRYSWQSADGQRAPVAGNTQFFFAFASGDVYLAGNNGDGTYELESNASVDGQAPKSATWTDAGVWTGDSIPPGVTYSNQTAADSGQGPGGGEFFSDRNVPVTGPNVATPDASHNESTTGALATLAGVQTFPITAYSTQGSGDGLYYGSGVKWLSSETGASTGAYDVVRQSDLGTWPEVRAFGKAGGLGDLQFLVDAAPVQIGNYVWFDLDGDGIQGPDEPAMPGIVVNLYEADGTTLVGTKTTNANGEYYFSTADGVEFRTDYVVEFVKPTSGDVTVTGLGTVNWTDVNFTQANVGTNAAIDSNPDTSGRYAFTVGGAGQNNHTLDAGFVIGSGEFSVTKAVTGSAVVDPDKEFTVNLTYTPVAPTAPNSLVLTAGETGTVSDLPAGTVVTLSEVDPTDSGDPATGWDDPIWSGTGVTDNGDGTASLTIGADTTVAATLTNPNTLITGGFELNKVVTGGAAGSVPADFEFDVDVTYDPAAPTAPSQLQVSSGTPAAVAGLPAGTVVTLSEVAPADGTPSADVAWGDALWTGTVLTENADGSVSFTVGSGSVSLTLTNPTVQQTGTFELTKSVTGSASDVVPSGHEFSVTATYSPAVSGAQTDFTLIDGQTVVGPVLPAGTTVTLTEAPQTDGDPHASIDWGTPTWSGTGVTTTDGSATFTVGPDANIAVGLENPATLLTGGFSIEKDVTGDAAAVVPDDFEFTVNYTYTDPGTGVEVSDTATVTKAAPGNIATIDGIPAGVTVTLSEAARVGAGPSVGWEDPVWTGTGITDNGDGTASITIAAGAIAAAELENPTQLITDGFTITKSVDGTGSGNVPNDFEFTVTATYEPAVADAPTSFTLSRANSTQIVTGVPAGTIVTLTEEPVGSIPNTTWGDPQWSVDGVAQSGNSASFSVDAGAGVEVGLINTATQQLGDITVAKSITGGAASQANTWSVDVDYSYGSPATTGTLTLTDGSPSSTLADLPAGAVVTFQEVSVSTAPGDSVWLDAVWSVDGSVVAPNGAGEITVTVASDSTVSVGLSNPLEDPEVSIEKGDGSATSITNDADTMDDATQYTPGETRTINFAPSNTGTEDLVDVVVTDTTIAGAQVEEMSCLFPGETSRTAGVLTGAVWTVTWEASASTNADPSRWPAGSSFNCSALLTIESAGGVHVDTAVVTGNGAASGKPVSADDPYNAFTADIQVIKYDGEKTDPAVTDGAGNWVTPAKPLLDSAQDANTAAEGVEYVADEQNIVRWVVTNTGPTFLTNLTLTDVTSDGPEIGAWTCDLAPVGGPDSYDFATAWAGTLEPGASFFCEGPLTLPENVTHADEVTVTGEVVVPEADGSGRPTGDFETDGSGNPVVAIDEDGGPWTLTDDDPFHAFTNPTPDVEIKKGDAGRGGDVTDGIVNDADTPETGAQYTPGETRTIVFEPVNNGNDALVGVEVTDQTFSGEDVQAMSCVFPGESDATAGTFNASTATWSVRWAASFAGTTPAQWDIDTGFTCEAEVTVTAADGVHVNEATVTGTGVASGVTVTDSDPYHAFTADIQVIKYDGERPDPAVQDPSGAWILPTKPLSSASQDANTGEDAVNYPIDEAQLVRWVATNTGPTTLTNVTLTDVTDAGPDIGAWTCDLTPVGGPQAYDFNTPWAGAFGPGQSFFCEGLLTLPAETVHADTVTVTGEVVVPEIDPSTRIPTGSPATDPDGSLLVALTPEDGSPWTLTDDDPFHARTPHGKVPDVDIVKGDAGKDGTGTTIINDADTMAEGVFYEPGETRTIVFRPTNTGTDELQDVVVTDQTIAGAVVADLACTFPGEANPTNGELDGSTWSVPWAATFDGASVWYPGESFDCIATLTIEAVDGVHVDSAEVTGTGVASGETVTAQNPYNAFTSQLQVIKYDGDKADPVVTDADGAWVVPTKPLVDEAQDANTEQDAVEYKAGEARTVRWVVTNTGPTTLTNVNVVDVTDNGPDVKDWTCDLSALGGTENYSFLTAGSWAGLFDQGASFFCEGTLTLVDNAKHSDTVTVTANVVVPEVDENGVPTGNPSLVDGEPVVALDESGTQIVLSDDDPFHAFTPGASLPVTGAQLGIAVAGLTALLFGVLLFMAARNRRMEAGAQN